VGSGVGKEIAHVLPGNTPHRRYLPHLVDLVATGAIDPTKVLTQREPLEDAIEPYKAFDRRESG
jgi:threonine dehydrogenase-like Zn-dependent dehydrogenase